MRPTAFTIFHTTLHVASHRISYAINDRATRVPFRRKRVLIALPPDGAVSSTCSSALPSARSLCICRYRARCHAPMVSRTCAVHATPWTCRVLSATRGRCRRLRACRRTVPLVHSPASAALAKPCRSSLFRLFYTLPSCQRTSGASAAIDLRLCLSSSSSSCFSSSLCPRVRGRRASKLHAALGRPFNGGAPRRGSRCVIASCPTATSLGAASARARGLARGRRAAHSHAA